MCQRGIERRLLLRDLFRRRLSISGGLLLRKSSSRVQIRQLLIECLVLGAALRQRSSEFGLAFGDLRGHCLLSTRGPFEASESDDRICQLALKRASDGRGFGQPSLALFLNAPDTSFGLTFRRRVQLVGELEDPLGVCQFLLQPLLQRSGVRELIVQCQLAASVIFDNLDDIG